MQKAFKGLVVLLAVNVALFYWLRPAPKPAGPNVVLFSVCSLRVDRLGCMGSARGLTPNMDAFAKRAMVFDNAWAQGSWTRPSHVALFTGRYPRNVGPDCQLPAGDVPLAQTLHDSGYLTCGVLNGKGGNLAPEFGFSRGFDEYLIQPQNEADFIHTVANGLRWVDGLRSGPFFLFLHASEVHPSHEPLPCPSKPPYDADVQRAHELEADVPALMGCTADNTFYTRFPRWTKLMPVYQLEADRAKHPERYGGVPLSKEVRAHIELHYDAAVREVDTAFGQLVDGLRSRGLLDNTMIVLVSDHGWELFDRGRFGHVHHAYDSIAHIPLVIAGPGVKAGRVTADVSHIDVAPTVLEAAGLPASRGHEGQSFAALLRGDADTAAAPRCAMSAVLFNTSIRMNGFELVVATLPRLSMQAYDLRRDPQEKHDVVGDSAVRDQVKALAAIYRKSVFAATVRPQAAGKPAVTDETERYLREKGYW